MSAFGAGGVRATARGTEMLLASGWRIKQDVRDLGEKSGWYERDSMTPSMRKFFEKNDYHQDLTADWEPIDRLAHLQVLLASEPYFGRSLRYFNDSAWWYRLEFSTAEFSGGATLRFEGVDYFAKVWLNGALLGEHEGYADPFQFEVGSLLKQDRTNVLIVKVSSPWDHEYDNPAYPMVSVVRNLIKGDYEHSDGFVQRDVNPVGIWRPVKLQFHDNVHASDEPSVTTTLSTGNLSASVRSVWSVVNDGAALSVQCILRILAPESKEELARSAYSVKLNHGLNKIEDSVNLIAPRLWTTWDRGEQPIYEAVLEIVPERGDRLSSSVPFGVRSVELRRSADETRFFLNGKPIYLRGTSYWSDLYLSNVSRSRYERDLQAAIHAGVNAVRVHVHTENPEFYEICDRLGLAVIQDNDLNWVFPTDRRFLKRAATHFGALIRQLRNHPSVIAWIAMNEVFWGDETVKDVISLRKDAMKAMGANLIAVSREFDETRPVIEDSGLSGDPASGDSHDYRGSLSGGSYFDIYRNALSGVRGGPEKLITEFGVDAPPAEQSLRAIPAAALRLREVVPKISELQDYQYHLLKYYIEHYRIQKYSPNAGYFQFAWSDLSPQSFYGIYDYWGNAKAEGIGGGLRAMLESNQPVGVFMEHDDRPHALHVVNDSSVDLGDCWVRWRVSTPNGLVSKGSYPVKLGPDSHQRVGDLSFGVLQGQAYTVALELVMSDGRIAARNIYVDPFKVPSRPEGYPERLDEELGMRLWWAGREH